MVNLEHAENNRRFFRFETRISIDLQKQMNGKDFEKIFLAALLQIFRQSNNFIFAAKVNWPELSLQFEALHYNEHLIILSLEEILKNKLDIKSNFFEHPVFCERLKYPDLGLGF